MFALAVAFLYMSVGVYTGVRLTSAADESDIDDNAFSYVMFSIFWPVFWAMQPAVKLGLRHGAKDREKKLLQEMSTDKLLEEADRIVNNNYIDASYTEVKNDE